MLFVYYSADAETVSLLSSDIFFLQKLLFVKLLVNLTLCDYSGETCIRCHFLSLFSEFRNTL